jgi:hypothetical protein
MMTWLAIYDDVAVVLGELRRFHEHQGKSQQASQGQVVQSADGPDHADGRGLNPVPEEPFDRQGGSDGVGVGIYGDEDVVLGVKMGQQILEGVLSGTPFVDGRVSAKIRIVPHHLNSSLTENVVSL